MSALKEAFAAKTSFLSGKGVPPEQITQAEQELGLSFSDEYREYLSDYGIGAYDGHELTGLTKSKRLNVITATTEARKRYVRHGRFLRFCFAFSLWHVHISL